MRIRTVKPEFFMHDGLFDAERESALPFRLGFIGLWCAADREGRFRWTPRRLGAAILPYDDVDFSRVLDALTTRGFVVKYRVSDVLYGVIPGFSRHQVINNRESDSLLPDVSNGELVTDADSTRDPRVTHASKAEGKGMERKEWNGKEGESVEPDAAIAPLFLNNGFDPKPPEEPPKPPVKKPQSPKQTPEQFIASLLTNTAFAHIDIPAELGRMDAWLMVNPGRQKTPRFVVNWLNKIQKPLTPNARTFERPLGEIVNGLKINSW